MFLRRSLPATVVFALLLSTAPAAAQPSIAQGELFGVLFAPVAPPASQDVPLLYPPPLGNPSRLNLPLLNPPPLSELAQLSPPTVRDRQRPGRGGPARPAWVYGMHAATIVLQSLDVHSTLTALDRGAVEANPLLSDIVHNPPAFIALKAGMTAGLIYGVDHMARRHPLRALLVSAAVTSAYVIVIAHNYRVAGALR